MMLTDLEQYFDDRILQRGIDYFDKNKVRDLEKTGDNHYRAKVAGSEVYAVELGLSDSGKIISSYCDCPYAYDHYCKHQAAVLLAIKHEQSGENSMHPSHPTNQLKDILINLKKEQLVELVLDIADRDPDMEKQLLFKYGTDENEVADSKKLIRQYINSAKRRGFIEWRYVDTALQGADLTLQKARNRIESGDPERAVLLSIAVLSIVIKMFDYSDDSNGSIGAVLNEAANTIDDAVTTNLLSLSEKEQKKLFELILKEAMNSRYDGWVDWRYDLLKVCTYFCNQPDLREKLENQLSIQMNQIKLDSWGSKFEKISIKLLQLEIIERWDAPVEAEKFIYENIDSIEFRKKAINREFEKENFEKVISLCLEGEEAHKGTGYVKDLKQYRYQAYELLGDSENQRKLAFELIIANEFKYYAKLKNLYAPSEWEAVLNQIVEGFQGHQTNTYLSILIEENLTDHILEYCKEYPSYILDLYPHLIEGHLAEVNNLFIDYIEAEAEAATDRKKYKKVCGFIKTYKKACGANNAQELVNHLKQKYPRRPAFLEELTKLK
ncbi:SWIM zinc finger family protein [Neobacillus sp. LXY-4]|uniref:SWIM zinc finger family protein n=1 Tax=Neobacillus sp. LXY-4 TaxID=3379826 RepID=UPI003EDFB001